MTGGELFALGNMVLVSLSRGDVEQAWKFVREMLPLWARPDRREIEGHYGPAESQFAGMLVDTARQLWADITLFWYRGQLRRTL